MDLNTTTLLIVVGVIALNQMFARIPAARAIRPLFWSMQVLNVLIGAWAAFVGMPGFERIPMVSVVVALLVLVHVAHNIALVRQDQRDRWKEEQEKRRRASRADR